MTNSQIIEALKALVNRIDSGHDLHALFTVKDSAEYAAVKVLITQLESAGEVDIEAGADAIKSACLKHEGDENSELWSHMARACAEAWKLKGRE